MSINPRTGRSRTNYLIALRVLLRLLKSYLRFCLVVLYMALTGRTSILTGKALSAGSALRSCVQYVPKLIGRFWRQYRHSLCDSKRECIWLTPNPTAAAPAEGKDANL